MRYGLLAIDLGQGALEQLPGSGIVGVELHRPPQIDHRLLPVSTLEQEISQIEVRTGVPGIESDHRPVELDRALEVTPVDREPGQVVPDLGTPIIALRRR